MQVEPVDYQAEREDHGAREEVPVSAELYARVEVEALLGADEACHQGRKNADEALQKEHRRQDRNDCQYLYKHQFPLFAL